MCGEVLPRLRHPLRLTLRLTLRLIPSPLLCRSSPPTAAVAPHVPCHLELPRTSPLSFRPSAASGEIYLEPGVSAAISFQAATGGAPFGCASLRPLPESTASSLRDNLYLQGPSPCTLRGWICPPCGSLKAFSCSVAPSCKSPSTAEIAKTSNIKVLTFAGVAGGIKLVSPDIFARLTH